jgi:hypothetical protein
MMLPRLGDPGGVNHPAISDAFYRLAREVGPSGEFASKSDSSMRLSREGRGCGIADPGGVLSWTCGPRGIEHLIRSGRSPREPGLRYGA